VRPTAPLWTTSTPTAVSKSNWCLRAAVLAAAVLAATGPTARAGFDANFTGMDPGLSMKLYFNGSNHSGIQTGIYHWTQIPPNTTNALPTNFWTFCIEVTQTFSNPVHYDLVNLESAPSPGNGAGNGTPGNPNGPMGTNKANMIRELLAYVAGGNPTAFYASLANSPTSSAEKVTAAAIQLSIWEIVFENSGTLDVSNGTFHANYAANASGTLQEQAVYQANNWLNYLTSTANVSHARLDNVYGLTSGNQQDQLVLTPVPAPSGLVLALTALVPGLAAVRLRRKG